MKQNLMIGLKHPFEQNFIQGFPETFPKSLKANKLILQNYSTTRKLSQKKIFKLPAIDDKQDFKNKTFLKSERPNRVTFSKDVEKDVNSFKNRKKIVSLMKSNCSKQTSITNKQNSNASQHRSFQKSLMKIDLNKFSSGILSSKSSKVFKHTPQKYPVCKVGKVRYRNQTKTPKPSKNILQQLNISKIQLHQSLDQEQLITLKELEEQLTKN